MHFVRCQLFGARAHRRVGDRTTETEQVFLASVPDHWHDQAGLKRHGDSQVDILLVDDALTIQRRIDNRISPQRVDHCPGNKRHVGELDAKPRVLRLLRLPESLDGGEIDVKDRMHMGRRPLAENHVLGDLLAHRRQRLNVNALIALSQGAWNVVLPASALSIEKRENVLLRDAATQPGSRDGADVNVVFSGDLTDERRRPVAPFAVPRDFG